MKNTLIFDFLKKHKLSYLTGLVFMFSASYIQTIFPQILGNTIDIMKLDGFDQKQVQLNIFYILLISAATLISTFIWRNLVIGNARKLECDLRANLFRHFQKLSPAFYSKSKTGDLIAYAINDIAAVRNTFGPSAAMFFNNIVICAASIYFMMTSIDLRLSLLTLSPLPIVISFMLCLGNKIQARFKTVQENFGAISDKVQENICGIRVIKAYVQEDQEIGNFERLSDRMMDSTIKMVRTSSFLSPVIELCFNLSFVLNLVIGGNLVLQGVISLGDFVAFNTYLVMIMTPIVNIGRVVNNAQRGLASLGRLQELFAIRPDIQEKEDPLTQLIRGNIEIQNLTFSYPGAPEPSLREINLKIAAGQTLGIIGKTGSGKSTLVNLLLRSYNVSPGQILLDDRDINAYSLASLRNSFGFVPQDTFLFSASIRQNIVFFNDTYSEKEIAAAARASYIDETIASFPDGFDTMLGERGVNLSGGQKQRIAIARALIREPAILILDDALSAVDTVTEAQILGSLKTISKNKTTLIISHRIAAVAAADEIIVLDNGRICEQGTHRELLAKGGLYYDIYTEQVNKTTAAG